MKVGIIGLGYVGLPLAVAFAEAGHEVAGVDVSERVVEGVNSGRSQVEDVADQRLAGARRPPQREHRPGRRSATARRS